MKTFMKTFFTFFAITLFAGLSIISLIPLTNLFLQFLFPSLRIADCYFISTLLMLISITVPSTVLIIRSGI